MQPLVRWRKLRHLRWCFVSAATVSGSSVVLDTSDLTPDASYTLTVQNVQDLYGNAIGSSSSTFKVRIVTYGEVIQSDGPIAYYRFEETSGMVAKNHGTLGEEADGLWMSGSGAADSIEVEANSDAGPSPADGLLGFGNDNRAAAFTGSYDQFWVDTQGQWLNGLGLSHSNIGLSQPIEKVLDGVVWALWGKMTPSNMALLMVKVSKSGPQVVVL